jgi:hypothetical protein
MFDHWKRDILLHRHRVEQRAHLEEKSKLGSHGHPFSFAERVGAFAVKPHFPGIGLKQSDDVLEDHALAAPAGADDDEAFPFIHMQIQMIQDQLAPESLDDASKFNQGHERINESVTIIGSN